MLTEGFEPIPGYRLENFLGRGQFGEVWRSSSPGGTHVALKFLNVRERQGRKEFRAIQKVKGIRHPHLVLTYALWLLDESMQVIDDAAFDSNQPLLNDTFGATMLRQPVQPTESQKPFMLVIATVLCQQNLMERLKEYSKKGEKFPFDELIGYIEDAAKAIDFLNAPRHELGEGPVAIHHCDIKPENIMVLGDLAVVGDFGVARILSSGVDSRATTMGGSVAYAAPETFDNRTEATSDQYSLAMTYYELRTGKLPFPEESQAQVIRDKLAGNLDFREVPLGEAKVLQRATAILPGSRFPSAKAFVEALRNAPGEAPRKSKLLPTVVALVLTGAVVLGVVSSAVWYLKLGPFSAYEPTKPSEEDPTPLANPDVVLEKKETPAIVVQDSPPTVEPQRQEPNVEPKSLQPSMAFVVSISGKGTHESISMAIAGSSAGDTIRIQEGTYRESIVIPSSIALVGEGTVRVVASEDACVKIRNESKVRIENIEFDSQSPNASAVEVESGSLELTRCKLFASSLKSLHCAVVYSNATFLAEECTFQTTDRQAVVAHTGASVSLHDSSFRFSGNSSSGSNRIGVQGNGARGLIQRCSFGGPCGFGIDWLDSPNQGLKVEGCRFENCDIAIQTKSCKEALINGSEEHPFEIINSVWGLNLIQSQVDVAMIKVDGRNERNRIAMRITDRSKVHCTDCDFTGHECGVYVSKSSNVVDRVSVRNTRFTSMFVDSATVNGNDLKLSNIARFGLVTMGRGASVKLNSLEVQAATKLTIPVYATSGLVEFKKALMTECLSGVFVDPKAEIINGIDLSERRSLIELIGNPGKNELVSTPIQVVGECMTLMNCQYAWIFNGIGTSRIKKLDGDVSDANRIPKLLKIDELQRLGTDLTNFEVSDSNVSKINNPR